MIRKLFQSEIFKNRYYIFGLALQKGLPFLIIPLVTWGYGRGVYAEYILIYALVQFVSMLMSLGVLNSVIVFWHQNSDKNRYVSMMLIFIISITLVFSIPLSVFLYWYFRHELGSQHLYALIFLTVLYVVIYNFNFLWLSVLRAMHRAKIYFFAVLASAIVLVFFLVLLAKHGYGLTTLLSFYISALFVQACLFFVGASIKPMIFFDFAKNKKLIKKILNYSIPIMIYTLVSSSVFTVDKWVTKLFFPTKIFIQYVYNFQFAYVVNLISVIIAMYNVPVFCQHIQDNDVGALSNSVFANYRLAIVASLFMAFAAYAYAWISNINLTFGFWILVCAFTCTNIFSVNVGLFESLKKSKTLMVLVIFPTICFWGLMLLSSYFRLIMFVYFSYMLYYAFLMIQSLFIIKRLEVMGSLFWREPYFTWGGE